MGLVLPLALVLLNAFTLMTSFYMLDF